MKKNLFVLILTAMIILSVPVLVHAAEEEYGISAIDLLIKVTDELNVLTRNVTDGNPALELLGDDANAGTIRSTFLNNNIYLNAFPDDLSFEIIVSATKLTEGAKLANFTEMDEATFNSQLEAARATFDNKEDQELIEIAPYETECGKFIRVYSHSTMNDTSVYVVRYQTVMNNMNYFFTLQSNKEEIDDELDAKITSIVDSARFTDVKATLSESPVFMEFYEMMTGFLITVLVLGVVLFFLIKSSKGPKRS